MKIGLGILLICFAMLTLYGLKIHATVVSVHAVTISDAGADLQDIPDRDKILANIVNNHKQLDDVHKPVGVIGIIGAVITFIMLIWPPKKRSIEPSNKEADPGGSA